MGDKRNNSRRRRKGCIAAHQAFDGRGRFGEYVYKMRAKRIPSLGTVFPWYMSDVERKTVEKDA